MEITVCGYSPEDKQLAEKIITHIKREVAQKHSYLEKGIFYLKTEATEKIEYLGANYTTLYYNPIGVIRLFEKKPHKLETALVHIVLHCMLLHPSFGMKDNKLFDAAADVIVNAMIENSSAGNSRECNNFLTNYKVSTAAQLYNAAVENTQMQKRMTALAGNHKLDDHCVWYFEPEQQKKGVGAAGAESEWQYMYNTAKGLCGRQQGSGTGNMFMSLTPPDRYSKFSYDEYIRRFTKEEILQDDPENIDMMLYTMSMDLYDDMPIVEWNEVSERCNPSDLIIAIDMSGSCGGETAANFLRQVYSLFESMNIRGNVNIHVVLFDEQILKTFIIQNKKEAEEFIENYSAMGFGGTDFNCVFNYADDFKNHSAGRQLKGLFFFSDACGFFPTEKKSYPTTFFVPEENDYFDKPEVPEWIELVHYND